MSETPPSDPFGQPPPQPFDYYAPPPDNAAALIRLTVIFNYISVGLDACLSLIGLGFGTFFLVAPDMAPHDPGDPPAWVIGILYLVVGLLAAAFAIVKVIGTRKLQLARPHAWGWALAAGIIGCTQLFCASCCCLQVAAGVYTVVILCLENVRRHLAAVQVQNPLDAA